MHTLNSLSPSSDIPTLADKVWLFTAAEGPPLAVQDAAALSYLNNRSLAGAGRDAHALVEARLRARLASMLGLSSGDIALLSNASEAVNTIVGCLDLQPGDNVVINDLEYPSMVQPWLRLASKGIELRIARHESWRMPVESLAALVDNRTKVIAVSHVSYVTGWRHDLAAISALADRVGAFVLLDATQSLGVVPVTAGLVDAVVCSSYKWLLGGHGLGILAWNQERLSLPSPKSVGWRSVPEVFTADRLRSYQLFDDARRFEVGFPSYPSIYNLDASTAWLEAFDACAIEEHVLTLSGRLVEELTTRGWDVMTPADPENRAGNVAVEAECGEKLAKAMAKLGIHCWGGDGRLRFSVHLFNNDSDIHKLLEGLDRIAPNAC